MPEPEVQPEQHRIARHICGQNVGAKVADGVQLPAVHESSSTNALSFRITLARVVRMVSSLSISNITVVSLNGINDRLSGTIYLAADKGN